MASRRAVPGRERPGWPARASRARQNRSVLSLARKSVMRAGVWPGQVRAWTRDPYRTVAVVAEGMWPAARARIQAAEVTGAAKPLMVPEMSQAMPSRSGGAGTRRLVVRVKGSAVGTAPAARCAWEARALPMRSRPGGIFEVVGALSRAPAGGPRAAR